MKNKIMFRIIIGSPVDYEDVVAYVYLEGEYIAILDQEEGVDNIRVEFFKEGLDKVKKFNLDLLMEALLEAKRRLKGK